MAESGKRPVFCTDCNQNSLAEDNGYGTRCLMCGGGRIMVVQLFRTLDKRLEKPGKGKEASHE